MQTLLRITRDTITPDLRWWRRLRVVQPAEFNS